MSRAYAVTVTFEDGEVITALGYGNTKRVAGYSGLYRAKEQHPGIRVEGYTVGSFIPLEDRPAFWRADDHGGEW